MTHRNHFVYWFVAILLMAVVCLPAAAAPRKKKPKEKPMMVPTGKAEIFELQPRGIRRGTWAEIKLIGTNLLGVTDFKFPNTNLAGEFVRHNEWTGTKLAEIKAAATLARGSYGVFVKNTNSESSRLKLYVDDLPQVMSLHQQTAAIEIAGKLLGNPRSDG